MPTLRGLCSFVSLQGIGRWGGAGFSLLIGTVGVPGGALLLLESIK